LEKWGILLGKEDGKLNSWATREKILPLTKCSVQGTYQKRQGVEPKCCGCDPAKKGGPKK